MQPLLYPESTWSARFGRVVRTLQVVAIAGAIGAVGGGIAVLSVMRSGPPRPPAAGEVSANSNAATAVSSAHGARQSGPPAAAAAVPATAPPASGIPQPPQLAAAVAPPVAPQVAGPAGEPALSGLYNRVEPAERSARPRTSRLEPKPPRRLKSAATHPPRERAARERAEPYASGPYAVERDDNRGYYPAVRGGYWGGGAVYGDDWRN